MRKILRIILALFASLTMVNAQNLLTVGSINRTTAYGEVDLDPYFENDPDYTFMHDGWHQINDWFLIYAGNWGSADMQWDINVWENESTGAVAYEELTTSTATNGDMLGIYFIVIAPAEMCGLVEGDWYQIEMVFATEVAGGALQNWSGLNQTIPTAEEYYTYSEVRQCKANGISLEDTEVLGVGMAFGANGLIPTRGAKFEILGMNVYASTEEGERGELVYSSILQSKFLSLSISVNNITKNGATITGVVNADGGSNITERGVCYATSTSPTVSDNKVVSGSGVGSYTCTLTGLQPNTTYYVRPYVINENRVYYGKQITFYTLSSFEGGELPGVFSVSASKQVAFSQGNLQYQASTDTWRFALHQYDYVGNGNQNISSTYSGWIDLFGWGTGDNPTNASGNYNFVDWGVNKISNGGNKDGMWRTLTYDEWMYLLLLRDRASELWGQATINDVFKGFVFLPDNWKDTNASFESEACGYDVNEFTFQEWSVMESYGAVFLPAAGCRSGTSMVDVGTTGDYWSSTSNSSKLADFLFFSYPECLYPEATASCSFGFSVRLCVDVDVVFGTFSISNISSNGATITGVVNAEEGANITERGVCYATSTNPTVTDNKVVNGSGVGSYTCSVTGLQPNTTYYVRPYVINENGTYYGEQISFTTEVQTHAILTVNLSEKNAGTFDGPGLYEVGEKVFLQANPAPYYRFVKWSDGSTQNPRRITMTEDITLIAYFLDELAEESSVNSGQVLVEPDSTNAKFSWPQTEGSKSYSLEIKKDGITFCTLEFNEYGQLAGIDFTTRAMTKGFQFKVTGLDKDSDYHFSLKAKDVSDNVIASYAGDFSTRAGSGSSVGESNLGEEDNPSGVSDNAHTVLVYGLDMHVLVQGAATQTISVYNVAGQLLEIRVAVSDKEVFDVYPEGVYIVNVGESTYKVVVK